MRAHQNLWLQLQASFIQLSTPILSKAEATAEKIGGMKIKPMKSSLEHSERKRKWQIWEAESADFRNAIRCHGDIILVDIIQWPLFLRHSLISQLSWSSFSGHFKLIVSAPPSEQISELQSRQRREPREPLVTSLHSNGMDFSSSMFATIDIVWWAWIKKNFASHVSPF